MYTGTCEGYSRVTLSNEYSSPSRVSVSPRRRATTPLTVSRIAWTCERGTRPICAIHPGLPSAIAGRSRPGCIASIVAISIARTAGWRTIAETIPIPTGISRVAVSAAVAAEIPATQK